jgi:dihydroorotate dehydrogenase
MNSEISALLKNDGFDSISDAVGVDAEIKNGI